MTIHQTDRDAAANERAIRLDERKKIIAQGCIHTRKRDERSVERADLEVWQTAQSEWFDPTMLEIVSEYAEWRDASEAGYIAGIREAECARIEADGWIVANGAGDRWRAWDQGMPVWIEDRAKATRYHRREDAEAVHAEDEDAWRIEPYSAASLGECICPKCGLRHGGSSVKDAGF